MDIHTTAQLLGNLGEFVGAIAVVVTLAYVALQVRQSKEATMENTKAVRSSIYESLNQVEIAFTDFYAEHASEIAELDKFKEIDQLTSEQLILGGALSNKCYRALETVYLHHKNGMLDDALLDARIRGFRSFSDAHPVVRRIWEGVHSGGGGLSDDFIRFMEDAVPSLRGN